jgi:hypothetical protein
MKLPITQTYMASFHCKNDLFQGKCSLFLVLLYWEHVARVNSLHLLSCRNKWISNSYFFCWNLFQRSRFRSSTMSYFDFFQDHSFILPTWSYYIYYILYYLNIYIPNFFYLLWALSLTFLTNKREQETHFLYFCFQDPYCIANAHTR